MSVIWSKVWFDLWGNKVRTLLAVVSIAAGVFAIGAVFDMVDQLLSGMDRAHQAVADLATAPESATAPGSSGEPILEIAGPREERIVLHGSYMNIPSMGQIIPKLAETHKVYALELQGHGRTTDIDRPITYQNLADDVAAFMNAVGLQKADVFGYSMGAMTGLQLAIRHPSKVNKLVFGSGPTISRDGSRSSRR